MINANPTRFSEPLLTELNLKNIPTSTSIQPASSQPKSKPGAGPTTATVSEKPDSAWMRFWFTPADPAGLHALRIMAGLLFLFWLLPFAGNVPEFFSFKGWFDRTAYREWYFSSDMARLPASQRPYLGWSLLFLVGENIGLVLAIYWSTIVVLVLFTLGLAPRILSVLTWILVVSFVAFLALAVGQSEDGLLANLAFYLMIGYVLLGQFSRDPTPVQRLVGYSALPFAGKAEQPSYAANLAVRLFQVNFALIVVVGCLHKLQSGDWWSGVALWYPLHNPFETTSAQIHAVAPQRMSLLFFYSLSQYIVLAWQLSFPAWAWRQALFSRILLVGGGMVSFLGCLWIYQIPVIGAFYLVGCLAFLPATAWRRLGTYLGQFSPKKAAAESASHRTPASVQG